MHRIQQFKTGLLLLFVGGLLFFAQPSFAQKGNITKEEAKSLKAEIKALKSNLNRYKLMKEEDRELDKQIQQKLQAVKQNRSSITDRSGEIEEKEESIKYLNERISKLRPPEVNATKQGRGAHDCAYSVQIGAYSRTDLTQYMDNNANFGVEVDNNSGLKKYTLGYFTSYWEAKSFSAFLNGTGAQTYVVGYYKGDRIPDLKDMTQCTF
ncbi:MAG: hypothetical protein AAFU64_10840 [Bacteroidota bacterium]